MLVGRCRSCSQGLNCAHKHKQRASETEGRQVLASGRFRRLQHFVGQSPRVSGSATVCGTTSWFDLSSSSLLVALDSSMHDFRMQQCTWHLRTVTVARQSSFVLYHCCLLH